MINIEMQAAAKSAIPVVTRSILDILGCKRDDETVRKALETLAALASSQPVNVSNCTFNGAPEKPSRQKKQPTESRNSNKESGTKKRKKCQSFSSAIGVNVD